MSDPIADYHNAVSDLVRAKAHHARNGQACGGSRLDGNLSCGDLDSRAAEESESALRSALTAARKAHRNYWLARQQKILPEVVRAADLLLRYDQIARCAGSTSAAPSICALKAIWSEGRTLPSILDEDGIPPEEPGDAVGALALLKTRL